MAWSPAPKKRDTFPELKNLFTYGSKQHPEQKELNDLVTIARELEEGDVFLAARPEVMRCCSFVSYESESNTITASTEFILYYDNATENKRTYKRQREIKIKVDKILDLHIFKNFDPSKEFVTPRNLVKSLDTN